MAGVIRRSADFFPPPPSTLLTWTTFLVAPSTSAQCHLLAAEAAVPAPLIVAGLHMMITTRRLRGVM
jgi:hypothetical protein